MNCPNCGSANLDTAGNYCYACLWYRFKTSASGFALPPLVEQENEIERLKSIARHYAEENAALRGKVEKAIPLLKNIGEIATRIRDICDRASFPKDALWIPTIAAHAHVINQDATQAIKELGEP